MARGPAPEAAGYSSAHHEGIWTSAGQPITIPDNGKGKHLPAEPTHFRAPVYHFARVSPAGSGNEDIP